MQTLKEAAHNYGIDNWSKQIEKEYSIHEVNIDAFKAGAEWQKQQYKEVMNLMRQLLGAYDIRYPDAKQLLAGYTNEEAFDKLNNLLELLQD